MHLGPPCRRIPFGQVEQRGGGEGGAAAELTAAARRRSLGPWWLRPAAPAAAGTQPSVSRCEQPAPGADASAEEREDDQDEQVAGHGVAGVDLESVERASRKVAAGNRPLDAARRVRRHRDRGDAEYRYQQRARDAD